MPPPTEITSARSQGRRILYLDDDEPMVEMIKEVLEHHGHFVSGFTSSAQAIETFRADPDAFDVVLTDFNMPGMSGLDVAAEIRRIKPAALIVLTSGDITEKLTTKAREAGIEHLMRKPNTIRELCTAIEALPLPTYMPA